ncbi:hypothetical protein [Streptomyces hebeiensis]
MTAAAVTVTAAAGRVTVLAVVFSVRGSVVGAVTTTSVPPSATTSSANDRLVESAADVLVMPHETADRQAYESATAVLLERADRLVAVWNGEPPSGKGGGTADVVIGAREAGLPVDVIWPDGAARRG